MFYRGGVFGLKGLLYDSLEDIDREQLYAAIEQVLQNPDGFSRMLVRSVYRELTFEELRPLFPAICKSIEEGAPSGVMFAHEIRIEGLRLLATHRVRETERRRCTQQFGDVALILPGSVRTQEMLRRVNVWRANTTLLGFSLTLE